MPADELQLVKCICFGVETAAQLRITERIRAREEVPREKGLTFIKLILPSCDQLTTRTGPEAVS